MKDNRIITVKPFAVSTPPNEATREQLVKAYAAHHKIDLEFARAMVDEIEKKVRADVERTIKQAYDAMMLGGECDD